MNFLRAACAKSLATGVVVVVTVVADFVGEVGTALPTGVVDATTGATAAAAGAVAILVDGSDDAFALPSTEGRAPDVLWRGGFAAPVALAAAWASLLVDGRGEAAAAVLCWSALLSAILKQV